MYTGVKFMDSTDTTICGHILAYLKFGPVGADAKFGKCFHVGQHINREFHILMQLYISTLAPPPSKLLKFDSHNKKYTYGIQIFCEHKLESSIFFP